MIVHVLDGTYELFRHFYGQRRFNKGKDKPLGAVAGVLHTALEMIEGGATHLGVATDHVVESFRNDLYPGYKTSEGVPPELLSQFPILEEATATQAARLRWFCIRDKDRCETIPQHDRWPLRDELLHLRS